MNKKFKLSAIFSLIAVFCLSLVLSFTVKLTPYAAQTESDVFQMEYGAGVKLRSDGLRFIVKMSADVYDQIVTNDTNDKVELWGYIAPTEEFDKVANYWELGKKVGGQLAEDKIYLKDDGYYYANMALTNVAKNTLQGKVFSAIAFIKDSTNSTVVYRSADLAKDAVDVSNIESQNRSLYQIVNSALLDTKNDYAKDLMKVYGEWYGKGDYPVIITSQAEYNAYLEAKAVVDNDSNIDNKLTSVVGIGENAPQATKKYAVTFYDGNQIIKRLFVEENASVDVSSVKPTRDGYEFVEWVGESVTNINKDVDLYAKWKGSKGEEKDVGDLKVYGVIKADGGSIETDNDVLGSKVILASGDLGDGAYFPGETSGTPDPTDENDTADQAYLAFDGNYGFGDYFVADFTGKNMPTLAFFANGYDKSIFYGDGTKNGVVVSTGLTWPDGRLFTDEQNSFCTTVFNGKGLCMWGPHMIYSTAKNNNPKGVLLHENVENVALGRANLVDNKQYRIIMGMEPGDDPINRAIKLVYCLYDLDNDCVVESRAINTYNFFADGWANAGQTRDQFCSGSIVAYGYFGTKTVLDKVYPIYENTSLAVISREFGMADAYNANMNGDALILGAGSIGDGASYTTGQNAGGYVNQSYYALNGNYDLDDYIAFDFTGKNMPEVAFFAKNYNNSMYAEGTSKQGIVVVTGVTTWDGQLGSGVNGNGTQINYGFPYMIQNTADGGFCKGALAESKLGRANLEDGKHYRVIMGFTGSGSAITLNWYLYDLDANTVVEQSSMTTWNFFTGSDEKVGNMTINDLTGSIVLYGKFGVACELDKIHGVFENSSIDKVKTQLGVDLKTVKFVNYDGNVLQETKYGEGELPEYNGETPIREGDFVYSSYIFEGWDKEISPVTDDIIYTAVFTGDEYRDIVKISGGTGHTYGVEQTNGKIVLKKSNLGNSANYTKGQNNAEGAFVHQSYLAFDGNYALNDYIAFDFTGKNLPEIAFFAKNYNDSMYAEGTSKQGVVVVTGITKYDGSLGSGVNGNGTQINYGFPYMIQDAADGGFCEGAFAESALGRANLVDGTHYRVIMGFTGSGNAITLNWYLYNLDTNTDVEQSSIKTWNFFTGSNAQVGNMKISDLSGSIVLYGKFGATCTLDKVHGVFEDTTIDAVADGLNSNATYTVRFEDENGNCLQEETLAYGAMPSFKGVLPSKEDDLLFTYSYSWNKALVQVTSDATYVLTCSKEFREDITDSNVTVNNENVVLGAGNIGDGANYTKGQNNADGAFVHQSYLAFDGNYALNDYIAFDFTGKNLPEIAFFAKNYNDSMYAEGTSKQGVVVVTGITTWDGQLSSGVNGNGTKINYGFPYMIQDAADGGFCDGAFASSALGRANLVDGTHYRVIMGFTGSGSKITLHWYLYNLDTNSVVEQSSMTTWGFFTGANEKVGNMTLNDLVGSIVLYGKFGTTTTIDKIWGVFEDTTLIDVALSVIPQEDGEDQPALNVPDYSKYTDQFDFYAYSAYSDGTYEIDGVKYYIGKNLANIKQYSLYGQAGMTIYFPQNDMLIDGSATSITNAKKLIDDLAKVGIYKTILQDSRILYLSMRETAIVGSGLTFADNDALDAYIYDCVKDYATYPGVYGIMLGDEPKYVCLSAYSAVYNSIKRVNEKYGFNLFIQYNLNPLNVTETVYNEYYPASSGTYEWSNYRYKLKLRDRFTDAVTRYTQYIKDFLDAMNPDSIMYDDYPLMEDENGKLVISDSYIPCLQIVAKAAADRGIKFYHVTQAYENNANGSIHRRAMTEAGAKWLNNILLGFGAKQIAYYTYYTRSESDLTGGESYVDGSSFVDYYGNPTSLYYWMQTIMANNQKFAPTIMQFDYKGSRYYKGSSVSTNKDHVAEITVSDSFTKLSAFAVDKELALVTELYDDENNYYMYMAMNISNPDVGLYTQTVTMTFSGYSHVLVYVDGVASTYALNNNVYTATLEAGEAVYVIPYN